MLELPQLLLLEQHITTDTMMLIKLLVNSQGLYTARQHTIVRALVRNYQATTNLALDMERLITIKTPLDKGRLVITNKVLDKDGLVTINLALDMERLITIKTPLDMHRLVTTNKVLDKERLVTTSLALDMARLITIKTLPDKERLIITNNLTTTTLDQNHMAETITPVPPLLTPVCMHCPSKVVPVFCQQAPKSIIIITMVVKTILKLTAMIVMETPIMTIVNELRVYLAKSWVEQD